MSFAPLLAASETREQVFLTEASKSSHSGSACVTAMRMDSGDVWAGMLVRYGGLFATLVAVPRCCWLCTCASTQVIATSVCYAEEALL